MINAAAATMRQQGATIVNFDMPDLAALTKEVATDAYEAQAAFAKYFATLPANAPVTSFKQLVDTRTASPAIQAAMEKEIALVDPMQSVLVSKAGEMSQPERNGVLSNATGMPAVTFQAGFSASSEQAPLGVPIGGELLGRDYSESLLLAYAYAFEQSAHIRQAPLSTPSLK